MPSHSSKHELSITCSLTHPIYRNERKSAIHWIHCSPEASQTPCNPTQRITLSRDYCHHGQGAIRTTETRGRRCTPEPVFTKTLEPQPRQPPHLPLPHNPPPPPNHRTAPTRPHQLHPTTSPPGPTTQTSPPKPISLTPTTSLQDIHNHSQTSPQIPPETKNPPSRSEQNQLDSRDCKEKWLSYTPSHSRRAAIFALRTVYVNHKSGNVANITICSSMSWPWRSSTMSFP